MEYKVCGDTVVLRLQRGEEIHTSLEQLCELEGIRAGTVNGLGAVDIADVGRFEVASKTYHSTELVGEMELASLVGNISTRDGRIYLHLHATLGGEMGQTWSGHLTKARISATGELFVRRLDTVIERRMDEEVGLNLMVL